MEEETNGQLQFLDTIITKNDGMFALSVYHKPTSTGVYLNWFSHVPFGYKIGLVKCLLGRAFSICTSWKLLHEEFENVK